MTSKTLQGAVKALRLLTGVGQPQEQRDEYHQYSI